MVKLYITSKIERGGAFWPIAHLLEHFHGVKCVPYQGEKKGTCLCHNVLAKGISPKVKKIVFVGGYKTVHHGIPRNFAWNKANHCVFQSEFFHRIAKSQYKINRSSVIQIVGGSHADPNIMIPLPPVAESIGGEIHFVMVAKWWKRFYKRYNAHKELFIKHILPFYPKAILHVFAVRINKEVIEDKKRHIIYYRKTFHKDTLSSIYCKSHIQLILTPFDSGPMTLNESMHYRVPFICGNNSCAKEFISMVDGKCGEVVNIDPLMKSAKHCKKYKPMINKKFYNRVLDNKLIMRAVHKVIKEYPDYTSWNWTDDFSYEAQANKWMEILFG